VPRGGESEIAVEYSMQRQMNRKSVNSGVTMNNTKSNLINDFFECDLKQLKKNYRSIQEINASNKDFLYRQGDRYSDAFWISSRRSIRTSIQVA
jgi:hypothetical protein